MSLTLPISLAARNQPDFCRVLADELRGQNALFLPLQRALEHGSHALVESASIMLLRERENDGRLHLVLGVSYASIIPGCACEADPTPMSEIAEYAWLQLCIDCASASAVISEYEEAI